MWKAFNSLFPLNTPLSEILPPAQRQESVANSSPRGTYSEWSLLGVIPRTTALYRAMFPNLRGGCEWLEGAIVMVGGRSKTPPESWRLEPMVGGPHLKAVEA